MTDIPGEGVLLLGGFYGAPPPGTELTDLWSFRPDGGWTRLLPETGKMSDGFAFDSGSKLAVLVDWGDSNYRGLWTYDPATGKSGEVPTTGPHPTALLGARLVYDANSDRMIMFGGLDERGRPDDETWALDLDGAKWERMHPKMNPPPQNFYAAAYDPRTDRVTLFSAHRQGTWAYDYDSDTWTELSPRHSPDARSYAAMAYDSYGKRMVLFGGANAAEEPFGDTWTYDSNKNDWTRLNTLESPSARAWHSMAFDSDAGKLVLFSGGESRDTDLQDVWLFDPSADTWWQAS